MLHLPAAVLINPAAWIVQGQRSRAAGVGVLQDNKWVRREILVGIIRPTAGDWQELLHFILLLDLANK